MLEIFPNVMRFSQVDLSNGKPQKLDFFALSLEATKDRIYFKNNIALNPNTGEVTTQDLHFRIFKSIDLKQHTTQIFDTQSSLVAILLPNGKTLLCAKSYLESFYFKGLFFVYVWMFCLHVCLCITCMPGAHRGQKRASDSLELELQMVVSHCVARSLRSSESNQCS